MNLGIQSSFNKMLLSVGGAVAGTATAVRKADAENKMAEAERARMEDAKAREIWEKSEAERKKYEAEDKELAKKREKEEKEKEKEAKDFSDKIEKADVGNPFIYELDKKKGKVTKKDNPQYAFQMLSDNYQKRLQARATMMERQEILRSNRNPATGKFKRVQKTPSDVWMERKGGAN